MAYCSVQQNLMTILDNHNVLGRDFIRNRIDDTKQFFIEIDADQLPRLAAIEQHLINIIRNDLNRTGDAAFTAWMGNFSSYRKRVQKDPSIFRVIQTINRNVPKYTIYINPDIVRYFADDSSLMYNEENDFNKNLEEVSSNDGVSIDFILNQKESDYNYDTILNRTEFLIAKANEEIERLEEITKKSNDEDFIKSCSIRILQLKKRLYGVVKDGTIEEYGLLQFKSMLENNSPGFINMQIIFSSDINRLVELLGSPNQANIDDNIYSNTDNILDLWQSMQDIHEAKAIIKFLEDLSNFKTEEPHVLFSRSFIFGKKDENSNTTISDTVQLPESITSAINEYANIAKAYSNLIATRERQLVVALINQNRNVRDTFKRELTVEDIYHKDGGLKDITWLDSMFFDPSGGISGNDNLIPQVVMSILQGAVAENIGSTRQLNESIDSILADAQRALRELGYGMKLTMGRAIDYDIFRARTFDGSKTDKLVTRFSNYWHTTIDRYRRTIENSLSSGESDFVSTMANYSQFTTFLSQNSVVVNPLRIPEIVNDPILKGILNKEMKLTGTSISFDLTDTTYTDNLKKCLGETGYNEMVEQQKEQLLLYGTQLDAAIYLYGDNGMMTEELRSWINSNSSTIGAAFIENLSSSENKGFSLSDNAINLLSFNQIVPLRSDSNTENGMGFPKDFNQKITDDDIYYDKNFSIIENNESLFKFYELIKQSLDNLYESLPPSMRDKILSKHSIPSLQQNITSILLDPHTTILIKTNRLMQKLLQSFYSLFSDSYNNDLSFARIDPSTGKMEHRVATNWLKTTKSKVDKEVDIAMIRIEQALKRCGIDKNQVINRNGMWNLSDLASMIPNGYLGETPIHIIGEYLECDANATLSDIMRRFKSANIDQFDLRDYLKEAITHTMVQNETFDLPKIIKLYNRLGAIYSARQQCLPFLNILKNAYESIPNVRTNKTGKALYSNDRHNNKRPFFDGQRTNAIKRFNSYFRRSVLGDPNSKGFQTDDIITDEYILNLYRKKVGNKATRKGFMDFLESISHPFKGFSQRAFFYYMDRDSKAVAKKIDEAREILDNLLFHHKIAEMQLKAMEEFNDERVKQNLKPFPNNLNDFRPAILEYFDELEKSGSLTEKQKEQKKFFQFEVTENDIIKSKELKDITHKISNLEKDRLNIGRSVTVTSLYNSFLSFCRIYGLGWNYVSSITNYVEGQLANRQAAYTRFYFTPESLGRANMIVRHSAVKMLSGKLIVTRTARKLRTLMDRYDVLQDNTNELQKSSNKSPLNGMQALNPYALTRSVEYRNQAPVLVAILLDTKITDRDNKNPISVWDAMDENGRLREAYRTDSNVNTWERCASEEYRSFYVKTIKAIVNLHGDYNDLRGNMASESLSGKTVLMFKRWFPRYLYNLFAAEQTDIEIGTEKFKGRIRSFTPGAAFVHAGLAGFISFGPIGGIVTGSVGATIAGLMGVQTDINFFYDIIYNMRDTITQFIKLPLQSLGIKYSFREKNPQKIYEKYKSKTESDPSFTDEYDASGNKKKKSFRDMFGKKQKSFSMVDARNYTANVRAAAELLHLVMLKVFLLAFINNMLGGGGDDDEPDKMWIDFCKSIEPGISDEDIARYRLQALSMSKFSLNKAQQVISQMMGVMQPTEYFQMTLQEVSLIERVKESHKIMQRLNNALEGNNEILSGPYKGQTELGVAFKRSVFPFFSRHEASMDRLYYDKDYIDSPYFLGGSITNKKSLRASQRKRLRNDLENLFYNDLQLQDNPDTRNRINKILNNYLPTVPATMKKTQKIPFIVEELTLEDVILIDNGLYSAVKAKDLKQYMASDEERKRAKERYEKMKKKYK